MKTTPWRVVKKRAQQRLVDKWERKLAAEGMPAEFPAVRRQALSEPNDTTSDDRGLASSTTYQHWTRLTHAAHALPIDFQGKGFVLAYVETGYLQTACTRFGLTLWQGRCILKRFAGAMKEQNHDTAD